MPPQLVGMTPGSFGHHEQAYCGPLFHPAWHFTVAAKHERDTSWTFVNSHYCSHELVVI